ncbi:MAG: phage major capsid protein [Pseudomonadota bacterium]
MNEMDRDYRADDLAPAEDGFAVAAAEAEAEETKAAAAFLESFEGFKAEIGEKLGTIGARVDALDAKAVAAGRPALARAAEAQPHAKAFAQYVRQGDDRGLAAMEMKALNTGTGSAGGHLVDPRTSAMIDTVLRGGGSLRAIARVVQVEAVAYDVLVDRGELTFGWQAETTAVGESTGTAIERVSIALHELSAAPQASQRLLDDTAFDVEAWLAERIGDRFVRAESDAFINGDGSNKPVGFLTKPMVPNAAQAWPLIGYVPTGQAGGFDLNDPGDALIDLVYALGAQYRRNAHFVMNSSTAGEVRKMKDSAGRFMWTEGLTEGTPARLLGYPVTLVEEMPDIGADAAAIAFGDFSRGYTIAERPEIRILRDPFSAKPNVMFYATKRVGGDVTDYAAIKVLRFAAA